MNIFSLISLVLIITLLYFLFSSGKTNSYEAINLDKATESEIQRKIKSVADLDSYLNESESKFADITPGAEKKIVWFSDKNSVTDIAIVYIHGFSASRQEVSPVTENLAARLGANLFLTRLSGHGRSGDAMKDSSVKDLLADALEAFEIGKKIGKEVIVIGMSTGSTLATWLAAHENQPHLAQLKALILLSPNYGLANPKSNWLLKPAARYWLPVVEGRTYQFKPDNEQQARFWSWKYPTVALIPMMELVNYVTQMPLHHIQKPVLVLYSAEDRVIDIDKMQTVYARIGANSEGTAVEMDYNKAIKEIKIIKGAQGSQRHVLAGDIMSPGTTKDVESSIYDFIQRL